MNPRNRRAYTGRSGQMAVMAELLDLGCNVAIPEVDVGKDLFAFQDDEEGVTHIQVKTAGKAKPLAEEGTYSPNRRSLGAAQDHRSALVLYLRDQAARQMDSLPDH